jgi:hypothetical protein
VLNTNTTRAVGLEHLTQLVYELLDAHGDTMALAAELLDDPVWAAHLNYLQGLQRVGREVLAHTEDQMAQPQGQPTQPQGQPAHPEGQERRRAA